MNFLVSKAGEIIISKGIDECPFSETKCKKTFNPCAFAKKRTHTVDLSGIRIFLCSTSKDHIASKKTFLSKANGYSIALREATEQILTEKNDYKAKITALLHNSVDINAHCLQEVFSLIPQAALAENLFKQTQYIEDLIATDIRGVALGLLKIAKYNLALKTELAAYKTLSGIAKPPELKTHKVHRVFLNVLHLFVQDFNSNKVRVNMGLSEHQITLDYETFHVGLFFVLDNCLKYVAPDSNFSVTFGSGPSGDFQIKIDMISMRVEPNELENIFLEGYSGKIAINSGKAGSGHGMYRAKRMFSISKATIAFVPHYLEKAFELNHIQYNRNEIIIRFPHV